LRAVNFDKAPFHHQPQPRGRDFAGGGLR